MNSNDYQNMTLLEKARTLRVETAALLSAAQIMLGKTPVSAELHGIPDDLRPRYDQQLQEKVRRFRGYIQ